MKLILQSIIDSVQFSNLPTEWQDFEFEKFSNKKTLFDYQQAALKNATKALYKYYVDCQQKKEYLLEIYKNNGLTENLDYRINGNKKLKIFEDYDKNYTTDDNIIPFYHFINRMSFWMATGSGKTLVIVKLLEILGKLIQNNQIPNNDILFLTYREDLMEQFDWWFFSKIDETLDEVYIPYYQPKTNRIEKYKPDFIFWLKKDNKYSILFVDPKGTEYADGYRKIDGYSRIFEEEENGKKQGFVFSKNGFTLTLKLLFKTNNVQNVLDNYKRYWFDNLQQFYFIVSLK